MYALKGLGFREVELGVSGLVEGRGLGVLGGLGFRVQGSGFRV